MDTYIVHVKDGNGDIVFDKVTAGAIITSQEHLLFLDEHGEDERMYNMEDVVRWELFYTE